jgi:ABC-type uncharacterized transport system ATPase component
MSRVRLREIDPSGSLHITGSFGVTGQTTFIQNDISGSALIVSGAVEIVQAQIDAQIQKAKLEIENLGTLGDRGNNEIIDLGGFF